MAPGISPVAFSGGQPVRSRDRTMMTSAHEVLISVSISSKLRGAVDRRRGAGNRGRSVRRRDGKG
jgi:hypothetical protein